MKVNVDLSALLRVIEELAIERSALASVNYGHKAAEVRVGIADLNDALKRELDVSDFVTRDETNLDMHKRAVRRFCSEWCHWSRQQEPGTHKRCVSCPLAPLYVNVLARLAEQVLT